MKSGDRCKCRDECVKESQLPGTLCKMFQRITPFKVKVSKNNELVITEGEQNEVR